MELLRRYVLAVTTAAILCAMVKSISPGLKGQERILRLVCGIFLLATVLQPLGLIRLPDAGNLTAQYEAAAHAMVQEAEQQKDSQLASIIQQETEAYILDKANTLGVSLEVQVELNESMVPCQVLLAGEASPYAKSRLTEDIAQNLGIPKERQVWNP